MNTATNTVVLVRNVLTKQIIAALASAPAKLDANTAPAKLDANTAVEEATLYGPTPFGRFIHQGRYISKEVVAQVWDVLTTGEAVDCPAPKRVRKSAPKHTNGADVLAQMSADIEEGRTLNA